MPEGSTSFGELLNFAADELCICHTGALIFIGGQEGGRQRFRKTAKWRPGRPWIALCC
jgi:hypothetical protein